MALDLEGHQSKSQRLFAACCRCVEWDLDETESLRCLGKYNNRRSFGLMLDDDSVRRRLRDAEAKVQRGSRLPAQPLAVIPIADLVANHPELRRPVIHGLLRAGETMNVIASPKVGKSWLVTDLALSVATGRDWLEAFKCEAGDVLIVDNVRGRLQDINRLASDMLKLEPGRYRLVVLDAFYRFLPAKTDENDNAAMAAIYNLIDSVASKLGCCFVLVHHSSKGNQSGKSVTDVGAGAGSRSRASDTHLVLRQHEEPDAIVLDAAVRSWPPIMPRCLRFIFPTFQPADELDPLKLRPERPKKKKQSDEPDSVPIDPEEAAEQFAFDFVSPEPQTMAAILDAAVETGMARRAAERLLKRAERSKRVHRWC